MIEADKQRTQTMQTVNANDSSIIVRETAEDQEWGQLRQQALSYEPFSLFLLQRARMFNVPFHCQVKKLLSRFYGVHNDPTKASIKGFMRMCEKVEDDYVLEGQLRPCSACLCDVVRCLLVCPTSEDLIHAFNVVVSNFQVVRVKNIFVEKIVPMGFRQILMNVLYETEGIPGKMICEIQLNLGEYAAVKHKIHAMYSISRIENKERVHDLLEKKARPF